MPKAKHSKITKILLAEDHLLVRETLMLWLEETEEFTVAGTAGDIDEVEEELETKRVDIVLLDLGLGDDDALHRIEQWKYRHPRIKFLVLSASRNFLIAQRALEKGAIGFVSKSDSHHDLMKGLKAARKGKTFLSESVSPVSGREHSGAIPQLTRRETEILRELASGQPNRVLASRLGVSPKTIERHRENIKHKLGLKTATEVVREAMRLFPSEYR